MTGPGLGRTPGLRGNLPDISTEEQPPFAFRLGCAVVPCAIAIGLLVLTWYGNDSWRGWGDRLTGHWEQTRGVVLRVDHFHSTAGRSGSASPVVKYSVGGRAFEVSGNGGRMSGFPERAGDAVDVLYKRDSPSVARLTNASDNIPIIVLTALGFVCLILGLAPVLQGSLTHHVSRTR
jgi:hypothetical protein